MSASSIFSEQRRPILRMSLWLQRRWISSNLVSLSCWARKIWRFFSFSWWRVSWFLGRSVGTVKLLNSFMLTLEATLELMAMPEGWMSVSLSLRRQPSRMGRFFSEILSFLLCSRSRILRAFSSSLNVKINSSDGALNGLSEQTEEAAVGTRSPSYEPAPPKVFLAPVTDYECWESMSDINHKFKVITDERIDFKDY